jgi:lipid-binding SYLF domain-containing protein
MGLKAGSVGFQVGGQETDVVLVFTHDDAPQLIAGENFQLGTKASIAAGPVGSTIGAGTDFKKGSAVYSYSTKGAGLFAGVSLDGSGFQIDDKGNRTAYPSEGIPTKKDKSPDVTWLLKTQAEAKNTPATVNPFVQAIEQRIGKK